MLRAGILSLGLVGLAPSGVADMAETGAPLWQPDDGTVIAFDVYRKGSRFGTHTVRFERTEQGDLEVATDVDLKVKFGPITAFKYKLDSTEVWRDGRLVSLDASANNDGDKASVDGDAQGDGFVVESTAFDRRLPASIIPSSHWNIKQVYQDQMLSTETGEVIDIAVEKLGPAEVDVAGQMIEATHYRLNSDITVDLWYDAQSRWVKLSFEARGQTIEYALSELY